MEITIATDRDKWRVALLAYDLAGRTLTREEVEAAIGWADSMLRLRDHAVVHGDSVTVKFLDWEIQRRRTGVDQEDLDAAAQHLERYTAAHPAEPG